jgi:zinc protease
MEDIQNFNTDDCRVFYDTFYAPNNATLVVVGDVTERRVLELVSKAYGTMESSVLPIEDVRPELPQTEERRKNVLKPTATEKLVVGYHAPAFGDFDHPALSLLSEVLFGGRASRVYRRLVHDEEAAVDVHAFVGPFHDPGLFEVFASAREGHSAAELLRSVDEEFAKVLDQPVSGAELDRAKARLELSLLGGLETVDGKASTIGFYDTVLGRPAGAFERLDATLELGPGDLLRAARKYLRNGSRSVIFVEPQAASKGGLA